MLSLVPEEARAAGPARARAVLMAAVVSAIHLEALGQTCMATAGPGEVGTLARHPQAPTPSPTRLPSQSPRCPRRPRAAQLLPPPALSLPQPQDPGPRRGGGGGSGDHGPVAGPRLTWAIEAPSGSPAWRQQPEAEEEEEALRDPCPHRPQRREVALVRSRPVLTPGSLRGLPGDLGGVVLRRSVLVTPWEAISVWDGEISPGSIRIPRLLPLEVSLCSCT